MPESIFASLKIALLMKIQSFVKCTCCTLSYPLSHHDSVFYVLILLSEALFLPFKSISSMGINKVELNMSWSRYEDVKAVWHLFSHSEIKYNVLIPNASDRINRNDLRFPPWEFCTKPPLDTHRMLAHTQTPVVGAVIDLVGVVKAGEHSSNLLIQSIIYVHLSRPLRVGGGKTVVFVSVVCWLWRKM